MWDEDFPDPQVVATADGWVALATNGGGANVQTLRSTDLVTWEPGPDALPVLPSWTVPGKVWAPEVHEIGGRWVMYVTTVAPDPSLQCVGVAVADAPEGPYEGVGDGPIVCQDDEGGSIDASPFVAADGSAWLYWKNDGNAVGVDTWLYVQPLSGDGLRLTWEPTRLLRQDLDWEGHLVEAPFVWEHEGRFHLFYSANDFGSADYAVGHAVGDSPAGPFTKDAEPVLVSDAAAAGPGHCALFAHDDRVLMAYHGWAPDAVGSTIPGRMMFLSEVTFDGDHAAVTPPAQGVPDLG